MRPPSAVAEKEKFSWRACPDEVGTKGVFFEIKLKGFRKEKEVTCGVIFLVVKASKPEDLEEAAEVLTQK